MNKINRKSLLYKSDVEYADFCLNHVEGCSHGCKFPCYAMNLAKRFGRIKTYDDWIKPSIVENSLELLEKEIPKYKDKIKFVQLCFMTDPFMYRKKEIEVMTLQIMKKLCDNGIKFTVLTKGIFPVSKINKDEYGYNNEFGITLVSLDNTFKKNFEPKTAPYNKRISALRQLHDKGFNTWVSMEPYPTPNLVEQNLIKILDRISFVDKIIFGKLNYNVQSSRFEGNEEFYEKCANIVIKYCEKHRLDYHIKYGTKKRYDESTQFIFSTEKTALMIKE